MTRHLSERGQCDSKYIPNLRSALCAPFSKHLKTEKLSRDSDFGSLLMLKFSWIFGVSSALSVPVFKFISMI